VRSAAALLVLALAAAASATDPPGSPAARKALAICERAQDAAGAEQKALFARGLARAEAALKADDRDALAHFAVFCNLGGQLRVGLGLSALGDLRRLRREIDRTLELAPDFPDALVGKGRLLLETPRLLGGDPVEGERLLRRALDLDPDWIGPRLDLARALAARGARADAATEARRALEIAERKGSETDAAEARSLLTELDAKAR
jgi:tetratricopeptide (TPR) repeat protein